MWNIYSINKYIFYHDILLEQVGYYFMSTLLGHLKIGRDNFK